MSVPSLSLEHRFRLFHRDHLRPLRRTIVAALIATVLGQAHALAQSAPGSEAPAFEADADAVDVKGVFQASLRFLFLQHAARIGFEDKTRRELGGPFFDDYRRSIRIPPQWSDGDSWLTNFVGHPVQGAASGFIWIDHDPKAPPRFALNRTYWSSRARATAFAAAYSAQFELGPLSEASIGNVGLRPETAGWVDHVVTPTGGLLFMAGEDALDRFVIAKIEGHVRSSVLRALIRMALNPSRGIANVASLRLPWDRPDRTLRH